MKQEEKVRIKLLSGCNVDLSLKIYDDLYCNFDEIKYFSFSNIINSGAYYPKIMQFICVLIFIFHSKTSFSELFWCNLLSGVFFTLTWFKFKLYKIPGINFISCLIGGNIFRYFLHLIFICVISLFVIKNWKIIIFCIIGGIVTELVQSILFVNFSNVKYNDEVVKYVSTFETKNN